VSRSPPAHHQSQDQDQARFNREVTDALGHILGRLGVDYVLVDVTVGTASTEVKHNLGRKWRGWSPVDMAVDTNIWRAVAPSGASVNGLWLQAGVSVAARILVF